MTESEWIIEKNGFEKSDVELNGSKFMIANGYMGFRGTLEEYKAQQLVSCNMAGLFDRNGNSWRESVNAPNSFYTEVTVGDTILNPTVTAPQSHTQTLNMKYGIHTRNTVFKVFGADIKIMAERFVSMKRENISALKYTLTSNKDIRVILKAGIDCNIWDINGPHLENFSYNLCENTGVVRCATIENAIPMTVYENIIGINGAQSIVNANQYFRITEINLEADQEFTFYKICGVFWGDKAETSKDKFENAAFSGYDILKAEHKLEWSRIWDSCDVIIEGDDAAQQAMRYSIYQLSSIAPRDTDKCGIPARGLSGQVYKGASFWDTEMFMLPFFSFTDETVAKNLVHYRVNTIEGAKRKAAEYGYDGAFYPWESQETGDDACTLFNVTDIFTNRPMRTYFRDRQIHVSADMVYGMWDYCCITGDFSILLSGGIEMIYECVKFFYTYSYFKVHKNRYELLNVVGPDEYHERVDNNAFTNRMVYHAVKILILALDKVKELNSQFYNDFAKQWDLTWITDFAKKLYVPQPDDKNVIEQFDGYMNLESIGVEELRKREIKSNEYWGGGHGIATTTRVLKQADVVMMLNVFRGDYSREIKKANWDFYETYTEHGSSLSACAYAIVAAETGNVDWAYKYFMKTACVDLTGNTRQYLGSLYIGGTHPAANGGSWNTAIFGFAGVSYDNDTLNIAPRLPHSWRSISFKLKWKGIGLTVNIKGNETSIIADKKPDEIRVIVNGEPYKF